MKIYLILVEYSVGCPEIYMAYRSKFDRDFDLEQLKKEAYADMENFMKQYGRIPNYSASKCELIE